MEGLAPEMRTGSSLAGKRQVKRAIKANMRWEGRGQKQMWLQEEIRRSILQGQKRWPMRDKEKRIAVMMSRALPSQRPRASFASGFALELQ